MQSMSVPAPTPRQNTEAAEQELIRLATQQSMAEAAPPAPQQLMRAEHELVRIATQQSLMSGGRSVVGAPGMHRPISGSTAGSGMSSSSSVYSMQDPHLRYADPRMQQQHHDPRVHDPRLRPDPRMVDPRLQQQHQDPRYQQDPRIQPDPRIQDPRIQDPRRQQGIPNTFQQQQMAPQPQYQQRYQQPPQFQHQPQGYPPQQGYSPQQQQYQQGPPQQYQQGQGQQPYHSPYDPRHNGRMPGAVGVRLSPDQRFVPNQRYGQQPQHYDDQSDNQSQSQYSMR
jgi:hypothetical protein